MRSCFLKNHNYFKDKLEIYKNLIKNKEKLKEYCRNNKVKNNDSLQIFQSINPKLFVNYNNVYLYDLNELFTYLKKNNIKNIIYIGGAGNLCVSWTRQYSMFNMKMLGFNTYFIKDYIFNITGNGFDSDTNEEDEKYTQKYFDQSIFETMEKYYGKSITAEDTLNP